MSSFKDNYPAIDSRRDPKTGAVLSWPFMGYTSEMVNMALLKDDPDGFVGWMREAGLDNTSQTFDGLSMASYCDRRNAPKCKAALDQLDPVAA